MEALIKMVVAKTGISEEQATTAVNTVIGFVKDKLPPGIATQLDALVKDDGKGGGLDGLKDIMGGMFKK